MNHSERVTELRKQIRAIDALLAKCAVPTMTTETQLEELYTSAQNFLKDSILIQERFKRQELNPELPDFDELDQGNSPAAVSTSVPIINSDSKPEAAESVPKINLAEKLSSQNVNQGPELETKGAIKEAEPATEKMVEKPSKPIPQSSQRLADKIHRGQVKDLRKALPLHEKFRFINELFKGSAENFDKAMNQFENAGSMQNAISMLSDIQRQENWESEHPLLEKLIELIEKRFS
jgi:hypothetical protein